jgi:hypothetical protein
MAEPGGADVLLAGDYNAHISNRAEAGDYGCLFESALGVAAEEVLAPCASNYPLPTLQSYKVTKKALFRSQRGSCALYGCVFQSMHGQIGQLYLDFVVENCLVWYMWRKGLQIGNGQVHTMGSQTPCGAHPQLNR